MGGSAEKVTGAPVVRPRRCVGCGEENAKKGLIRIVRSPEGSVALDTTGKAAGRGAYICADVECVRLAKKRNALSRALKQKVPDEIYSLAEEFCLERSKLREE